MSWECVHVCNPNIAVNLVTELAVNWLQSETVSKQSRSNQQRQRWVDSGEGEVTDRVDWVSRLKSLGWRCSSDFKQVAFPSTQPGRAAQHNKVAVI